MPVRVTTEPTQEPLRLSDLKARLQVDHDDDDAVLASLLVAARQRVEAWEWRKHITQTLTLTLDRFPPIEHYPRVRPFDCQNSPIFLPYPPLQSVTSIQYYDESDVLQVFDPADYEVDTASEPGRVQPVYHETWPCTSRRLNAVTVVYVAGHADPCDVPQSSLIAIAELVRRSYGPTADCEGGKTMPANAPDWIDVFLNKAHDARVLEFV